MPATVRMLLSALAAVCAVGGPAHACDINSATDLTCGSASINPANPNSPNNPGNPNSPLNINNPANPLSPNNPNSAANVSNPYSPYNLAHPENPYSVYNPSNPNNPNNPLNPNSPQNINNPANPLSRNNPDNIRREAELRYRFEVLGEPRLKNGVLGLFEGDHPVVTYGGIGHERECRLGVDCPRSVYTPDMVRFAGQPPEDAPVPPHAPRHKRHGSER